MTAGSSSIITSSADSHLCGVAHQGRRQPGLRGFYKVLISATDRRGTGTRWRSSCCSSRMVSRKAGTGISGRYLQTISKIKHDEPTQHPLCFGCGFASSLHRRSHLALPANPVGLCERPWVCASVIMRLYKAGQEET